MATQTQIVREAPEVEALKLGLMESTKDLINKPLVLPDAEVAELTQLQQDAIAKTGSMYDPTADIDAARGQLSESEAILMAMLGQDGGAGIQAAMNPYIDEVINRSVSRLQDEERRQQNMLGAKAADLNAFGSRADLMSGVISADAARAAGDLSANLLKEGFTDATNRMSNVATGIASLAGQGAGLGELQQALEQQGIGFMFDVGTKEQAQNQVELDTARQNEMQDLFEPYKRIAFGSDIYAGAPSGSMTTTEGGSSREPSAFEKLFGNVVAGVSAGTGINSLFG